MTYDQEIEKMTRYTKAVRRAWRNRTIYEVADKHGKEIKDNDAKMSPFAIILLNKWSEAIGKTDYSVSPHLLLKEIAAAEHFLNFLSHSV